MHACTVYKHTYIKWYTTTGTNNLQSEGMVTLTNKQTPTGTDSYTQRLGDGQLRKYARPSFLGSEWRSKHNSKYFPCCHLLYFLCLIHQERAQEVAREVQRLHGMARNQCIPLFPISLVFSSSQMLIEGKSGGEVGPYLSPGENEM